MSFPISGGAPSGSGLDPAADEAAPQPTFPHTPTSTSISTATHLRADRSALLVPRSTMSPGTAALIASAGRSCDGPDLSRGDFYRGDMPVGAYLRTNHGQRVQQELEGALHRLLDALPVVGQRESLALALDDLCRCMRQNDERHADMLGHGKRWLEQLLRALESPPPLSGNDRANICGNLTRALMTDSMSPGKAFGMALQELQSRIPGASEANGFRAMLQERALMMWITTNPDMAQRAQRFSVRDVAAAVLEGFGFSRARPRTHHPLPAVTAQELSRAADAIEHRLGSQVVPVAHDILTRLVDCFDLAYRYRPPSSRPLSPDEQVDVLEGIKFLQSAMRVTLTETLRAFSPTSRSSWTLVNSTQLAHRIRELLPELGLEPASSDRPSGLSPYGALPNLMTDPRADPRADALSDALVTLPPPSEGDGSSTSSDNSSPEMEKRASYRQDSGSGATGTFSAGTGGASRRGPT